MSVPSPRASEDEAEHTAAPRLCLTLPKAQVNLGLAGYGELALYAGNFNQKLLFSSWLRQAKSHLTPPNHKFKQPA